MVSIVRSPALVGEEAPASDIGPQLPMERCACATSRYGLVSLLLLLLVSGCGTASPAPGAHAGGMSVSKHTAASDVDVPRQVRSAAGASTRRAVPLPFVALGSANREVWVCGLIRFQNGMPGRSVVVTSRHHPAGPVQRTAVTNRMGAFCLEHEASKPFYLTSYSASDAQSLSVHILPEGTLFWLGAVTVPLPEPSITIGEPGFVEHPFRDPWLIQDSTCSRSSPGKSTDRCSGGE